MWPFATLSSLYSHTSAFLQAAITTAGQSDWPGPGKCMSSRERTEQVESRFELCRLPGGDQHRCVWARINIGREPILYS